MGFGKPGKGFGAGKGIGAVKPAPIGISKKAPPPPKAGGMPPPRSPMGRKGGILGKRKV